MKHLGILIAATAMLLAAACQRSASQLDQGASATSTSPVAKVVDKPAKLEFYIMSKCPFGVQVENAIGPVLDKLGPNVDFHVGYIGQKNGDDLASMHGPGEVGGDIAQLCAKDIAPDKYFKMVLCQNKDVQHVDTNWEDCGKQAGIDTAAVKSCIDSGKGKTLLAAAFDDAKGRGASGSPTMFLNGQRYEGGRKPNDFLRAICNSYQGTKPDACNNIPVAPRVAAIFLSDKRCAKCDIAPLEPRLKSIIEGLEVKKLDYADPEGKALYESLAKADPKSKFLPLVLFDSSLDADTEGKQQLARYLHTSGNYQVLALGGKFDPTAEICDNKIDDDGNGKVDCDDASCKESMSCRPEMAKKVDLFVMSHCPYGTKAMIATKEFHDAFGADAQVDVHFIGDSSGGNLTSMHGPDEVTDDLREVCAAKYYAKDAKFLDFLACRSQNVRDPDWKKCAVNGIDADVIQKCVDGEGKQLLTASFAVASALDIGASPTFLVNNRETFNAQDANGIKTSFCQHNPGIAACGKQLTSTAPAGSAPAGGACGAQ